MTIAPPDHEPIGPLTGVRFRSRGPANVDATDTAVTLTGPGCFEIRYHISTTLQAEPRGLFQRDANIELKANLPLTEPPLVVAIPLRPASPSGPLAGSWATGDYTFYE